MKRSRTVVLSLLSATALGLTSCESRKELKTCVDPNNVMQNDDKCRDEQRTTFVGPHYYHWLYGGVSRDSSYIPGRSILLGGSSAPEPGVATETPSEAAAHGGSISEGHVSYHGFGAHGGEGEGHAGGEGHGSGGHGGAGE